MKKSLKVLLVEDTPSDVDMIKYELRKVRKKIEFLNVWNERDFKLALKNFSPGVILSDFSMPGFDGMSALKIARKRSPDVPFIFVSGTIGEERAISALKNGATDYIIKDHISALSPKFNRALKESRARREKNLAEKKLIERESQLLQAQEVAQIGSWRMDLKTKETTWTDQTYKIFGYDITKYQASLSHFLSRIHPDDQGRVSGIRKEIFTHFKQYSYSTRIVTHDTGEVKNVILKGHFELDKSGEPIIAHGIVQDVTQLTETERKLEQKNKELTLFIYKSSHDLRGPISSAIGLCNIAQREASPDPVVKKYITLVGECVNKLDTIIGTLTTAMNIRESEVQKTRISFHQIFEEVTGSLKYLDSYNRIRFNTKGFETQFFSDKEVIRTIFHNMIENSIKYQNMNIDDPIVNITVTALEDKINIEFTDNGIGITEQAHSKVYDMFFRGTQVSKGSGLGLYIVKNAVEKINGRIEMKSSENKGTTFELSIPAL